MTQMNLSVRQQKIHIETENRSSPNAGDGSGEWLQINLRKFEGWRNLLKLDLKGEGGYCTIIYAYFLKNHSVEHSQWVEFTVYKLFLNKIVL